MPLLLLGLAISVPLIVAGAALIMALLNRLPLLIWAGAMLLGWIAGDVAAIDPAIRSKLQTFSAGAFGASLTHYWPRLGFTSRFAQGGNGGDIACGVVGVIVVLVVGAISRRRQLRQIDEPALTPAGEACAIDVPVTSIG